MSGSYVISDSNGVICGETGTEPFTSLAAAQAEALSLANTHASGDPNLSVQNTAMFYVCVLTSSFSRDQQGITLTNTRQNFNKTWTITEMV